MNDRAHGTAGPGRRPWRRLAGVVTLLAWLGCFVAACDDSIAPTPPKAQNLPPETFLQVDAESLAMQLYRIQLRWLGSDADGAVKLYRYRWVCEAGGGPACAELGGWHDTTATNVSFKIPVPDSAATYTFDVAAVDDDGQADPTPATQRFHLYNTPPVVSFEPGTRPTQTLPAVTFYLDAVDADTTATPDDRDSRASIVQFRAWLDDQAGSVHTATAAEKAITFRPEDFGGNYGPRTVYVQAVDDGTARSHTDSLRWTVVAPPQDGILLVDDCQLGGGLADFSDGSYRRVLEAAAPGRYVVLDIKTVPRLSSPDLDATLSLFDRVVWYTDADNVSSGALALARGGLRSLLERRGGLFLCSGLAFGTGGAFGDQEADFLGSFGIDSLYHAPDGSTNFGFDLADTVQAAVQPSLTRFHYLSLGLGDEMECFAARADAATQSLYFYPAGTFVRATSDSLHPFVNPVQFDIGVAHTLPDGAHTVYVSLPIGLPINDNAGENEVEIRALLERAGILSP